jgi:hypothetical protein
MCFIALDLSTEQFSYLSGCYPRNEEICRWKYSAILGQVLFRAIIVIAGKCNDGDAIEKKMK